MKMYDEKEKKDAETNKSNQIKSNYNVPHVRVLGLLLVKSASIKNVTECWVV